MEQGTVGAEPEARADDATRTNRKAWWAARREALKEVRENQLRIALAALPLAAGFGAFLNHYIENATPPMTRVSIPHVLLQEGASRRMAGGVQIVPEGLNPFAAGGDRPSEVQAVAVEMTALDGKGAVVRPLDDKGNPTGPVRRDIPGPISVMSGPALNVAFADSPDTLVFCLKTRNDRGGVSQQRIVMRVQSDPRVADLERVSGQRMPRLYQRLPDAEAPASPPCRFG